LKEEKKNDFEEMSNVMLRNIQRDLPKLEAILYGINECEEYEDYVYRFYHYSFKVYRLQYVTQKMVEALMELNPNENKQTSRFFEQIILDSMKVGAFKEEHNKNWTKHTRPIIEAFLHAKYFIEMAVKYGKRYKKRKTAPHPTIPTGWAALLELYNMR